MKKAPSLYEFNELPCMCKDANGCQTMAKINGRWVPARSLGLDTLPNRFRLAWMVFTGKADAILWPEGQ